MFIIENFFSALTQVLQLVIRIYMWVVIARTILSWINPNPFHPAVRFINEVTEPPLGWIRRKIPAFGGIDISPLILIIALLFIDKLLVSP